MRVIVGSATHIGLVRDHNEDAFLVEPPLYAVADGMGGHLGGEVASSVALDTLQDAWRDSDLATALRKANDAVYGRALRDITVAGMGTTLTAVVVEGEEAHLAHVGDSRAYLMRGGDLRALTDDHSLVGEMVRSGDITDAEARVHPRRNIMTRAIGIDPNVEVDEDTLSVSEGDRILLCSDGLCGIVTDSEIRETLTANDDPQTAADVLVELANSAGGFDNVTVVVIDLAPGDAEADPETGTEAATTAEAEAAEPAEPERDPKEPDLGEPQAESQALATPAATPGDEADTSEPRARGGFFRKLFRRS